MYVNSVFFTVFCCFYLLATIEEKKKKLLFNPSPPPHVPTYASTPSHCLVTNADSLHLCGLFHIWMMRWYICLFLLLTHTRTHGSPHTQLCGHSEMSVAKVSCTSSSHEGIYLAVRERIYLCIKC